MNCRAIPAPQPMPTACQRFDQINALSITLYDAVEREAPSDELRGLAVEIQNQAVVGAAYERRRERGETFEPMENSDAR